MYNLSIYLCSVRQDMVSLRTVRSLSNSTFLFAFSFSSLISLSSDRCFFPPNLSFVQPWSTNWFACYRQSFKAFARFAVYALIEHIFRKVREVCSCSRYVSRPYFHQDANSIWIHRREEKQQSCLRSHCHSHRPIIARCSCARADLEIASEVDKDTL